MECIKDVVLKLMCYGIMDVNEKNCEWKWGKWMDCKEWFVVMGMRDGR